VASTALGQETLEEKRFFASLIYQFDAGRIRRALAWIFVGS
jgi:hypothetical protein